MSNIKLHYSQTKNKMDTTNESISLYIVETDRENGSHHGLHTNTSPFVISSVVYPGDKIAYILRGEITRQYNTEQGEYTSSAVPVGGSAELSLFSFQSPDDRKTTKIRVLSHLGRGVFLGEDGAENAFGHECLSQLFIEIISGAGWIYAPIEVERIEQPSFDKADFTSREWWEWICDETLKFSCSSNNIWIFDENRLEVEAPVNDHLLREREEYLRGKLRGWIRQLTMKDFEGWKQFCVENDPKSIEWIQRKEGREWEENPVAMTIYGLALIEFNPDSSKKEIDEQVEKLSLANASKALASDKYKKPECLREF